MTGSAADPPDDRAARYRDYARARLTVPDLGGSVLVLEAQPAGEASGRFPWAPDAVVHVLTAFDPGPVRLGAAENARRQRALVAELPPHATRWDAVAGAADGSHREASVVVLGLTDARALEIARRFGQDAIFRWTSRAWSILPCDDAEPVHLGWSTVQGPAMMSAHDPREPSMPSDEPLVLIETAGAVRTFTLNDPDRRNAISVPLRRELRAALEQAMTDDDCRAVILTGAGTAFSSGGDLSSMPRGDRADARDRLHLVADVIELMVTGPTPVIAAVEGAAVGAGTSLVAACDYAVAGRGAKFGAIFNRIGLVADSGLHWTLPRKVGPGPARRMLLRGRLLDGEEAGRLDLVDEVVDDGTALSVARERAEELAGKAPLALAATKHLLAHPASLTETLHAEEQAQVALFETQDFAEGNAAFFERREPRFTGR